jgi:hypothetical protein
MARNDSQPAACSSWTIGTRSDARARAFSCLAATASLTCLAVNRTPRKPPSLTPRRLAAASAAFVRSEIISRSCWAITAIMPMVSRWQAACRRPRSPRPLFRARGGNGHRPIRHASIPRANGGATCSALPLLRIASSILRSDSRQMSAIGGPDRAPPNIGAVPSAPLTLQKELIAYAERNALEAARWVFEAGSAKRCACSRQASCSLRISARPSDQPAAARPGCTGIVSNGHILVPRLRASRRLSLLTKI